MSVINKDVKKSSEYDRAQAKCQSLEGLSLSLAEGDKVVIDSTNQVQKMATFTQLILGRVLPTTGSIRITGKVFPFISPFSGIRYRANVEENLVLRGLQSGLAFNASRAYMETVFSFEDLSKYRVSIFGSLPRDIQILISCVSFGQMTPQILVLESWALPASEYIKDYSNNCLIELVKLSKMSFSGVPRPKEIKPLSTHEMVFCPDQGVELLKI